MCWLHGGGVMQSRQHHVHAALIGHDGRTAARFTLLDGATHLMGNTIARHVTRRNVRLNGSIQDRLAGPNGGALDGVQNRRTILVAWSFLAERRDGIGNQAGSWHERHLVPVDFVTQLLAAWLADGRDWLRGWTTDGRAVAFESFRCVGEW